MKLHLLPTLLISMITLLMNDATLCGQICDDWKAQSTAYVVTGSTPDDPDFYQWEEKSNPMHGVHLCVLNADVIPVYIQQKNNYINFTSRFGPSTALLYMLQVEVNVNNAGYVTIYSGSAKQDVVWYNSSALFPDIGEYNLKVRVTFFDGTIRYREYQVKVIPASQRLYKDNVGNTLRKWEGNAPGDKNAIVFSEGFDAYNTNGQEMYYQAASDLIACFNENGYDVYLLDNFFGTQSIRNNAAVFASAVDYISSLNDNKLIVAGGVSMGGIISRYALARAEQENKPLPVHTFIAIDSPHQGAVISEPLQNFKKANEGDDEFAKYALSNIAAKQLLNYNAYDPDGTIHDEFYAAMNSLNGDGYPHFTRNIGVSFSTDDPNPNSGTWYKITYHTWPISGTIKSFDLTSAEKTAGSWLPKDLTSMSPIIKQASYWWFQLLVPGITPLYYPTIEFERFTDPAYIPYTSALDMRNGRSMFDVCIVPESTSWHDVLPEDILEDIVNAVIKTTVYIQNENIYGPWAMQGEKVVAGNYVTSLLPKGDVIVQPRGDLTIKATDRVMLQSGFRVSYGGIASILADPDLYFECSGGVKSSEDGLPIGNREDAVMEEKVIVNPRVKGSELKVTLYPNPAQSRFTVHLAERTGSGIQVEVYDMMQRPVKILHFIPGTETSVDISDLSRGTYSVRISDGGRSTMQRLVKM